MPSAGDSRRSPFSHRNNLQNRAFSSRGLSSPALQPAPQSNFSTQRTAASKNLEYVGFQRKVLSKLGYFGISTARIQEYGSYTGQHYELTGNTTVGILMYFILHVNVSIKAVFLAFLVTDYFGPIEFLDKIASLDYILCTGLVVIGAWMFLFRYPFYGKCGIDA